MKAVFFDQYGGPEVLTVKETQTTPVGDHDVLIRNHASSITTADTFLRKGEPHFARLFLGWRKPKNPMAGTGFAGTVMEVGRHVVDFKPGDRVYGESVLHFGANAECVTVNTQKCIVRHLPEGIRFEDAAPLCDGALTSFNFLTNLVKVAAGQQVLVNGAAGGLGTAAIQIAKSRGAIVTAVCSAKNHAMVTELGADHVIDYAIDDFTQNTNAYDIIYDTVGKSSFKKARKALKPGGTYLSPVLSVRLLLSTVTSSIMGNKKAKFDATGLRKTDDLMRMLDQIQQLLLNKQLTTIIDRQYKIEQIVEAHRYLETGHKRGNLILTFS